MTKPELLGVDPRCETIKLALLTMQCANRLPQDKLCIGDEDWREFCRRHLEVCEVCKRYNGQCPS